MGERPGFNPEQDSGRASVKSGGPEVKGRGVFYDTYEVFGNEAEQGTYALKIFKLDKLFTEEQARTLFSKQAGEYESMKPYFSSEMLPPPTFIVADKDKEAFDAIRKNTNNIYTYSGFVRNLGSSLLQGRRIMQGGRLGSEATWAQKAGRWLGAQVDQMRSERKKFFGAILQEYTHGVPFKEVLQDPNLKQHPQYAELQKNVQKLIEGIRRFHNNDAFEQGDPHRPEFPAFTWHGFGDDNVTVETSDGEITGRVVIIDSNFSQRPDALYQRSVIKKLETSVLQPLETHFDLQKGID